MQLVECVPNFSEGRDKQKIKAITDEIVKVKGIMLLDVDPGEATNRTVVTFIGPPDAVVEAAFQAIKKAAEVIDMRTQTGEHPRQGATDVCPFVPVSELTMEDCAELARRLGKRVGEELEIPVYLYEYAATRPEWKSLANIRTGEYEALEEKLKKPEWKPDFGPARFNARAGVTVIGAREFLIAYNVNLNTRSKRLANRIAKTIREKGTPRRDENRKLMRDGAGNLVYAPGLLKECRAVGWYIDEYDMAQISINLTNYNITPIHLAFDTACEEAAKLGLRVTGSEVVGLVPKEAMLMAGRHYLEKQSQNPGVPEKELIRVAVQSMGLAEVAEFDPQDKIIEYAYKKDVSGLVDMRVHAFMDLLSTDAPAPGGGSVAALNGALSASLSAMVAALTESKRKFKSVRQEMRGLAQQAQALKYFFLQAIDDDTDAFNEIMDAFGLPKKTEQEQQQRADAIEAATKKATLVPFSVLEKCGDIAAFALQVADKGNPNSLSDAGVAGLTARAAAMGAYYNVLINVTGLTDAAFVADITARAKNKKQEVLEIVEKVEALLEERLQS